MSRRRLTWTKADIENPQLEGLPYYMRELHAGRYLMVLKMAAMHPGFTQKDLAVMMRLHVTNVGYLCRHLVDSGHLVMTKTGGKHQAAQYWLKGERFRPQSSHQAE